MDQRGFPWTAERLVFFLKFHLSVDHDAVVGYHVFLALRVLFIARFACGSDLGGKVFGVAGGVEFLQSVPSWWICSPRRPVVGTTRHLEHAAE